MAPRETENNAYAKFWTDKQRALWYVMVFSGVVNGNVSLDGVAFSRLDWLLRGCIFSKATRTNNNSNRTPFVITYNPALPISITARKNINILQSSSRCRQIFPSPPMVAFKRSTNLRGLLVRSTSRDCNIQLEKPSLGVSKCNHPRCLTCPFLQQGLANDTSPPPKRNDLYVSP